MTAIALIGGDGAGKTTLAQRLVADYPRPVKYLYMGINAGSSNVALPSTRLMYALKTRKVRAERSERGEVSKDSISLYKLEDRRDKRGKLWSVVRLMNRIAEESFRQVVSWTYQLRGFVVIYDRHFLFDFTPAGEDRRRLSERIHRWILEHVYPKPHLALFLDAPPSVLLERKQEVPEKYLEERRIAFLKRGSTLNDFVVIDASLPADAVYVAAADAITNFLEGRRKSPFKLGRAVGRSDRGAG